MFEDLQIFLIFMVNINISEQVNQATLGPVCRHQNIQRLHRGHGDGSQHCNVSINYPSLTLLVDPVRTQLAGQIVKPAFYVSTD